MENKKYWQNFGQRNQSEAQAQASEREFQEELPAFEEPRLLKAVTPRRDFLKYMGFSTAAAAIAASCEMPIKKAIPFVNKPEDITPGVASYYATTYVQNGDVVSVLAKVRDGRPIKIEGNELSPLTKGGTSAMVQASVLDLYDTARLRYPYIGKKTNEVNFEAIDKAIVAELSSLNGAPVVIVTGSITSPTTKEVINQFLSKYPGSKHVQYDAVSHTGMLLANEASYGKRAIPSYRFDKAKVIVSIGADFLATWLSPVEFARQYAAGRKINEQHPEMSHHIQFESLLSVTGANADERYLHKPSETSSVVLALYQAVSGNAITVADAKLKAGIQKTAQLLLSNKGAALVVCGSNDVANQIVVNAINEILQAGGNTIDWSMPVNYRQGVDAEFAQLVEDMNAGKIGAVLWQDVNPVYSWHDSEKVINGIKKLKFSVSFNAKADETTQLCKYVIPDHHYLESWGDAEPKAGYISLIQPTINPLFKTRQWQDSLLKWSAATTPDYLSYLKQYWIGKLGSEAAWNKALQDGVINPVAEPQPSGTAFNAASVAGALNSLSASHGGNSIEAVFYQKIGIGAGQGASNPWLQELPDPISKVTWDNYVVMSPAMAKSLLNIDLSKASDADAYEVHPAKPVVKVTINKQVIELPVMIIPGTHPQTIGIALGYGRTPQIGKAAENVGKKVFHLTSFNGTSVQHFATNIQIEKTGKTYELALTQTHNLYDTGSHGVRTEVMKEFTLDEFKKHPDEILKEREEELKHFGGLENFDKQGTLYPYYDKPGIHWAMSIDLNSCIGCGACAIACHAENNVPVVGKDEVKRFHDMHWMRIDRYYSGNMENPDVVFQPMMCQHCDNAPCENVCPVSATNHSSEGMNQMIYNRCIGTRYCANNCPYKVRRFNWADYTGADSFPNNQGVVSDVTRMMNDELTRMVLNPDVTVRSRGVMEKCSFCIQRTQEGKLKAKKESRPIKTGENNEWDVKTACQQACPTEAIVFGNINDSNSAVSQMRKNNSKRLFFVIEQLHTLPNVNYLAKVRNKEEKAEA
jgi:molybdopterin-containing oxidoreductase family iron-sulfur binding subunit